MVDTEWGEDNYRDRPEDIPAPEPIRLLGDLERYGESGWRWTVGVGESRESKMRTNKQGRGMWAETPDESGLVDPRQVTGTGQYSLIGNENAVKKQLLRTWYPPGWEWE